MQGYCPQPYERGLGKKKSNAVCLFNHVPTERYACVGQLENIIILSTDYIYGFVLVVESCTVYFYTSVLYRSKDSLLWIMCWCKGYG